MENNKRDRKLDQWLDEALSNYSAAEPRFGLEQRVLNCIRGEEQHSRKRNFWRWMPAFGAIAAVIVVAVTVGPMLIRKPSVRQTSKPIGTFSAPTAKTSETKALSRNAVPSKAEHASAPTAGDTRVANSHANVASRHEPIIAPEGGDRDKVIFLGSARSSPQLDRLQSDAKKAKETTASVVALSGSAAMPPAPPPLPPAISQVQAGATGGVIGGAPENVPPVAAKSAPRNTNRNDLKSRAETAEVQTNAPVLLKDEVPTESASSVIAEDMRRKEGHSKPEAARQDKNTIEAFGVTVRFQTGPEVQQFPIPIPLSKQERLALAAGRELKSSAVAQHKSSDIQPIEIEDVEIKPLEGPEKEK